MDAPALKREPTLCDGLVEAITAALRLQADRHGVRLAMMRNAEDVIAHTDRKVLSTLVMGLITRAIESTPGGMVHVSVLRRTSDGAGDVEIAIAETPAVGAAGGGRTPPDLGLGEKQELAALLGGTLSVHCSAGSGSSYVLHFPER